MNSARIMTSELAAVLAVFERYNSIELEHVLYNLLIVELLEFLIELSLLIDNNKNNLN